MLYLGRWIERKLLMKLKRKILFVVIVFCKSFAMEQKSDNESSLENQVKTIEQISQQMDSLNLCNDPRRRRPLVPDEREAEKQCNKIKKRLNDLQKKEKMEKKKKTGEKKLSKNLSEFELGGIAEE